MRLAELWWIKTWWRRRIMTWWRRWIKSIIKRVLWRVPTRRRAWRWVILSKARMGIC